MKKLITLLLVLISLNTYSQSTKDIKEYYEEIYRQENLPEKSISVINAKLAETLRPEQKNWLLNINHKFDMITITETYNYLNEIWQKTVIATYNKKIENTTDFPISE